MCTRLYKLLICILWLEASACQNPSTEGVDGNQATGEITLRVPQDFSLCNMNGVRNQLSLPLLKVRAWLREGDVSLPLDQSEFEREVIDRVEISSDGKDAEPQLPGEFRFFREPAYEVGKPDWCIFHYSKPYEIDAGGFEVSFGFWLECQEGAVWELPNHITPMVYPCGDLDSYDPGRVVVTAQNGDRIEFDFRLYEECNRWGIGSGLCPKYLGDPTKGKLKRGTEERVTTDYFHLALDSQNHNRPSYFLMVFEQPLGDDYGIILEGELLNGKAHFLDASLSTLRTEPIESIQYEY